MGLFGKKESNGSLTNVIRCDLDEYLVWKWVPAGLDPKKAAVRSNAIRYDSRLRVKDGETAVFVYTGKDGKSQDFIEGPCDVVLKTANLPILATIAGKAFGGASPFQAEIYFINMAGVIQIKFGVPYFDVFDPRFLDYAVPFSCHGRMTFRIPNAQEFIKLHRLIDFDLSKFQIQIRDAIIKYVKGIITNVPADCQIPLMQIERKILQISEIIYQQLKPKMRNEFGVDLSSVDISDIMPDKDSEGYVALKTVTQDQTTKMTLHSTEVSMRNMSDMQAINAENLSETLRLNREESAYAQRMRTDSGNFAVHQLNKLSDVSIAGANALGNMGTSASMNTGNGGFNPAGIMAGIAMGGAISQNLAAGMNQQMGSIQTPPSIPQKKYHIANNGNVSGPFDIQTILGMIQAGTVNRNTMVWTEGMDTWDMITSVSDFSSVFPPIPPVPPTL